MLMALAKGFGSIEAAAADAVRDIVEGHGFTLWDVQFIKEGASWYLRIFIDRPQGVSIDDVESIDGLINETIDKQDFIDKIDYLEIGSAGLERSVRRIDQLAPSLGQKIKLRTYKLQQGLPEKSLGCVLEEFDGAAVTVSGEFGRVCVPLENISAINYDDFDDYDKLTD